MRNIFVVIALLFGAYSIIKSLSWKELPKWERAIVVVGVIVTITVGGYSIVDSYNQKKDEEIKATYAELMTKTTVNDDVQLVISGTKVIMAGEQMISILGKNSKFRISKVNGKLNAYVEIPDVDGKIIAIVDGDYWQVFQHGYDYNNDDFGFEVVTPDRRVVFQIDLQFSTAYLAGLIVDSGRPGHCWYVSNAMDYAIANHDDISELQKDRPGGASFVNIKDGRTAGDIPFVLPSNVIQPLFRYPRNRFLHKRVKPN